jgi:hypothetical protein
MPGCTFIVLCSISRVENSSACLQLAELGAGGEREILDVNCELILMARDVTETAHSLSLFISLFLSLSLFRVVSCFGATPASFTT